MDIFNLVAWSVIGILNLCSERVSKFDYAMMWIMLIVCLISKCIGA